MSKKKQPLQTHWHAWILFGLDIKLDILLSSFCCFLFWESLFYNGCALHFLFFWLLRFVRDYRLYLKFYDYYYFLSFNLFSINDFVAIIYLCVVYYTKTISFYLFIVVVVIILFHIFDSQFKRHQVCCYNMSTYWKLQQRRRRRNFKSKNSCGVSNCVIHLFMGYFLESLFF